MNTQTSMVDLFKEKAKLVSAIVSEVSTYKEAFKYCVDCTIAKRPANFRNQGSGRTLTL